MVGGGEVRLHPVRSSAVLALGYRGRTMELSVIFASNPALEYVYVNVPLFIVGAIFRSRSKGRALNKWIIDKAEYRKKGEGEDGRISSKSI